MCAYVHVFWKQPECALIGPCALIRMNMVGMRFYAGMHVVCPTKQLFANDLLMMARTNHSIRLLKGQRDVMSGPEVIKLFSS